MLQTLPKDITYINSFKWLSNLYGGNGKISFWA